MVEFLYHHRESDMKKAILYKKIGEKNKVQCLACSHYCMITEGKRGICQTRENKGGKLYVLTYGNISALHVDPIEKKPLYHFYPGTEVLSLGTVGCNFRCSFCQNWDISQYPREHSGEIIGQNYTPEEIVDYALAHHIPSIAYTYNEPAIFFEFTYDVARLAHKKGLNNVYVSNGYESKEALEMIHPYLDAINIDLKSFREKFYVEVCGGHLQPVLDTIQRCKKYGIWQEITTLIIPGYNDRAEELRDIAEFIVSVDPTIPWHISRFFPQYKMMDISPTPFATLEKAYEIGKKAGLHYVYVGNIETGKYESTYCKQCGAMLIERKGYGVEMMYEKGGKCPQCHTQMEGIFSRLSMF